MLKKIILFTTTVLATIGFLFWRVCLIGNCIEPLNGFFYPEANKFRYIFTISLFVLAVIIFIISLTDKAMPNKPLKQSKSLGILSILYSGFAFFQGVILFLSATDSFEKFYALALFVFGLFMFYYAYCLIFAKEIKKSVYLIPLFVFVFRLGCVFVDSFGIIKSSEVVLNIFALVFCVLFFECFARYNAFMKFNFIKKPFLALGVFSPIVIFTATLGNALTPLFFNIEARPIPTDSIFLIASAIYIYLYTIITFLNKGVKKA